jgi:hypothetical protein
MIRIAKMKFSKNEGYCIHWEREKTYSYTGKWKNYTGKICCSNYSEADLLSFKRMICQNSVYTITSYKPEANRSICFITSSQGIIVQIISFGILESKNHNL